MNGSKFMRRVGLLVFIVFFAFSTLLFNVVVSNSSDSWQMFRYDPENTGVSSSSAPIKGDLLWQSPTEGPVYSSPAVYAGRVFVGSDDFNVYAMDANDGSTVWVAQTGDKVRSSPAVASDYLFVGSDDGVFYCLDFSSGSVIDTYQTGDKIRSSPVVTENGITIVSTDGFIYHFSLPLTLEWKTSVTGTGTWEYYTPVIVDNTVYMLGGTYIYALDEVTGDMIWEMDLSTPLLYSSPVVVNNTMYVGADNNRVYCLDLSVSSNWDFITSAPVFSTPAVAYAKVFVGDDVGDTYILDSQTGSPNAHPPSVGQILSSPAVADEVVFVGSYDNNFYAFNITDGSVIWNYLTGDSIFSSPAVANKTVFVGSTDWQVYAFKDTETDWTWIIILAVTIAIIILALLAYVFSRKK